MNGDISSSQNAQFLGANPNQVRNANLEGRFGFSPAETDASFPDLIDPSGRTANYLQDQDFLLANAATICLGPLAFKAAGNAQSCTDTPVAGAWSIALLDRETERHYFRALNFVKYQAAVVQAELKSCRGHAGLLPDFARKMEDGIRIRNSLVESNLRLAISIAKKYSAKSTTPLDDLVSVGSAALMSAVEHFDYRRGFRFSTYAYQAVQRSIYSALRSEYKLRKRFATDDYDSAQDLVKDAAEAQRAEVIAAEAKQEIESLLGTLPPRDRLVVTARFGIGQHSEPRSFQGIANTLGISKQRVATIFSEAIEKLRRVIARRKANQLTVKQMQCVS